MKQEDRAKTKPKQLNSRTGSFGERVAERFYVAHGFSTLARNYHHPWVEIDLIMQKNGTICFIEVKTVSYETKKALKWAVLHETWRPEEQVHHQKLHQLKKGAETWLSETGYTGNWQIDVAAVRIVPRETFATVNILPNIGTD